MAFVVVSIFKLLLIFAGGVLRIGVDGLKLIDMCVCTFLRQKTGGQVYASSE
jgi:hypothetical protein